jgi:hypothetical protein
MGNLVPSWRLALVGAALLFGAAPARADEPAPPRSLELRNQLAASVSFGGFDDPKTTLAEALDQLAKRYNLTFDVNEKAFRADDLEDALKVMIAENNPIPPLPNATLATVLRKILSRVPAKSGAVYVIRRDHIEITTEAALRQEFYADRPRGPFPPLVCASFERTPLAVALRELAQDSGRNVLLDVRVEKEGKTPITVDLENVPLDTAVRLLANMAGLRSVVIDGVLYVTSIDNARVLEQEERDRAARQSGQARDPLK